VKQKVPNVTTNMKDCCLYGYQLDEGIPYIDFNKIMNLNTQRRNCKTELELKFKENEFLLPRGIELKYLKETEPSKETKLPKKFRYFEMAIGYDNTYKTIQQTFSYINNKLIFI